MYVRTQNRLQKYNYFFNLTNFFCIFLLNNIFFALFRDYLCDFGPKIRKKRGIRGRKGFEDTVIKRKERNSHVASMREGFGRCLSYAKFPRNPKPCQERPCKEHLNPLHHKNKRHLVSCCLFGRSISLEYILSV